MNSVKEELELRNQRLSNLAKKNEKSSELRTAIQEFLNVCVEMATTCENIVEYSHIQAYFNAWEAYFDGRFGEFPGVAFPAADFQQYEQAPLQVAAGAWCELLQELHREVRKARHVRRAVASYVITHGWAPKEPRRFAAWAPTSARDVRFDSFAWYLETQCRTYEVPTKRARSQLKEAILSSSGMRDAIPRGPEGEAHRIEHDDTRINLDQLCRIGVGDTEV
jgi:hypothetical protein